jgi:hypothetical protein
LEDERRIAFFGFAHQQVNVLGHDYIPDEGEKITGANVVEDGEKRIARTGSFEKWQAPVTTESDELEPERWGTRQSGHSATVVVPVPERLSLALICRAPLFF